MTELEKAFETSWHQDHYHGNYKECAFIGFKAGAQWQAMQSPWIKTSERLPTPTIEMVDGEEYGSVFVIGRTSKFETPDLHSYYGYDGNYKWEDGRVPDYWMAIPELPKE